jgi:hypothetical protein
MPYKKAVNEIPTPQRTLEMVSSGSIPHLK